MRRLLCWFGRHAWQFDGVVYASPSYRCRRCGRREARNFYLMTEQELADIEARLTARGSK